MNEKMPRDLKERTRDFALRIIRLYVSLPRSTTAQVIGKQVLRAGTSVGAHYREACRAKSNADFVNKLEGALQELEETGYWLELLGGAGIVSGEMLAALRQEAEELIAILVAIVKSTKARGKPQRMEAEG